MEVNSRSLHCRVGFVHFGDTSGPCKQGKKGEERERLCRRGTSVLLDGKGEEGKRREGSWKTETKKSATVRRPFAFTA